MTSREWIFNDKYATHESEKGRKRNEVKQGERCDHGAVRKVIKG